MNRLFAFYHAIAGRRPRAPRGCAWRALAIGQKRVGCGAAPRESSRARAGRRPVASALSSARRRIAPVAAPMLPGLPPPPQFAVAWPAPVPPREPRHDFLNVCRCPSGRLCACRHPLVGGNCGCACAEGRAAWCEHCRAVVALPPATAEEKARAAEELLALERAELAPEWERLDARGRTALAMHKLGMAAKAKRYAECGRTGFAADCREIDAHRFYQPFRCGSRYCAHCGPATMRALMDPHLPAIVAHLEREPVRPGPAMCGDSTAMCASYFAWWPSGDCINLTRTYPAERRVQFGATNLAPRAAAGMARAPPAGATCTATAPTTARCSIGRWCAICGAS